jgi:hypothetical protein
LDSDGERGVHLHSEHRDVMLEVAATSFQVHLQVPAALLTRAYSAALLASAFTVALMSRSAPGIQGSHWPRCFARTSKASRRCCRSSCPRRRNACPHLRLHNGTIWRWNRPLVGLDDDGRPHLRIKHRPMATGQTLIDMMPNLAFDAGLACHLASDETPPESLLPLEAAQSSFYAAARGGLQAELHWLDDSRRIAAQWLLEDLIPLARDGLDALRVAPADADRWLDVIERRVASGQTGAVWQRRLLDRHGFDLAALTLAYARHQAGGEPVHLWP